MAPRARWLASSGSQQRALLPWVGVGQIETTFERAARRTECVVWSACEVAGQQTMEACRWVLLARRTATSTAVQTCGLRGGSSVGGRRDARACAARHRGPSGAVLAMGKRGRVAVGRTGGTRFSPGAACAKRKTMTSGLPHDMVFPIDRREVEVVLPQDTSPRDYVSNSS